MKCPRCGTENVDYAVFCAKCGAKLVRPTSPPSPGAPGLRPTQPAAPAVPVSSVQTSFYYAGFWKRFLAVTIDVLLINIILAVIFAITRGGEVMTFPPTVHMLVGLMVTNLMFWVVFWLYNTIMESSSKQATLGKMALGIIVTDLDGNRLSFGKANARYWGKILSVLILYIGFIMAGFTEKKQGLHDILAGTLVINKKDQPTSSTVVLVALLVILILIVGFGKLVSREVPKNPQKLTPLASDLQSMTVKVGMLEIKFALDRYGQTSGGTYPETLSDQSFVSILPHGQMPPSPYKSGTFMAVAEEKAVDDPVSYASQNSGCSGAATEGEINYYYSPDSKPTSWAINGCGSEGVIKSPGSDDNFVIHK